MVLLYVQRKNGVIIGLFANPQPQPDGSVLTDPLPLREDDPEIVAFMNPAPDPRRVLDEAELAAGKADANLLTLINMDPQAIAAAIDNAFPDPAQRVILKRLARVTIFAARRVLR